MGTTVKISVEEFRRLQEAAEETVRYELDEGELILTPSPTPRHNLISLRIYSSLANFAKSSRLGVVVTEMDFRLSKDVIRKPDVAFISRQSIKIFDLDHTPVEGPPTLAVEVISPGNLAQDTAKKIRQYLAAGTQAVWLVYPALHLLEVHDRAGIRQVTAPDVLKEERLFPGLQFSLDLTGLFAEDLEY